MNYMGSKRRVAKHILPIMLAECQERNLNTWVEPFVGGANLLDKVPPSFVRIGFDANPHTIAALQTIRDAPQSLPDTLSEDEYRAIKGTEPHPTQSWARFVCSFGARFDEGYARSPGIDRNFAAESKRSAVKQSNALQGVVFTYDTYENINLEVASLVYCDPPYKGTKPYRAGLVPKFDHDKFFEWCVRMKNYGHSVFVSEYEAPFTQVWEGEVKTNFSSTRNGGFKATEKLFKV